MNCAQVYVMGQFALFALLALLQYQQGESDPVYRKGQWFLYTTCDLPEDTLIDVEGFLGIDLGVVNIAVDSDGQVHPYISTKQTTA